VAFVNDEERHRFDADPDSTFHFHTDPDPDLTPSLTYVEKSDFFPRFYLQHCQFT
jgi:hypothetical protein